MMSKVNCEAVRKRRQASLRMARAELLLFYKNFRFKVLSFGESCLIMYFVFDFCRITL